MNTLVVVCFDDGSVYAAHCPIVRDGETWIYYSSQSNAYLQGPRPRGSDRRKSQCFHPLRVVRGAVNRQQEI